MRILVKYFREERITRQMSKKDKKMSQAKEWATVGVERKLLEMLRQEADSKRRSAQEMLCIILEERYAPK